MGSLSITQRIEKLAKEQSAQIALIVPERTESDTRFSWRRLNNSANHFAATLTAAGVRESDVVAVALPNSAEHVVATLAAWKVGATVVPVDPGLRGEELTHLLSVVSPTVLVRLHDFVTGYPTVTPPCDFAGPDRPDPPPPARAPRSAAATGGTQGRPRVIFRRRGWLFDADGVPSRQEQAMGITGGMPEKRQTHLVAVPLFHSGFGALYGALGLGHRVVLLPRFIPSQFSASIERYSVNVLRLVPSMMKILLLPGSDLRERNLSSLRSVQHGTAPCPPEVKRAWLDLVGPERVFEGYSSQEQFAYIHVRGDEWLAHPGSVGRPEPGQVVIVDEAGAEAASGVSGQVFFHSPGGAGPDYLGPGVELPNWRGDHFSVGDRGHLDEQGYLFLEGRENDLINVGGISVYPAEVEAVLLASSAVADACVIPREHSTLGQVPHAVVVLAAGNTASVGDLDTHCRCQLSAHKVPQSYELVASLPRNEAGKLRRSVLRTPTS
jgi:bile acid-coenzyme A ligase